MRNLRDAGGHRTRDGEVLRTGVLWRGDAPFALDDEDTSKLSALELSTVIDLRRPRERERRPYDSAEFGARALDMPLLGDEPLDPDPLEGGLVGFNRWVYEQRGAELAQVFTALAAPGALPALVHCTAGKDRTGLLIALIQSWLDVPDETIAADYALSAEALRVSGEEALELQRIALGWIVRARPELLEADPEWIIAALDDMRAAHGDAERYLAAHGVQDESFERLRGALLEATCPH